MHTIIEFHALLLVRLVLVLPICGAICVFRSAGVLLRRREQVVDRFHAIFVALASIYQSNTGFPVAKVLIAISSASRAEQ